MQGREVRPGRPRCPASGGDEAGRAALIGHVDGGILERRRQLLGDEDLHPLLLGDLVAGCRLVGESEADGDLARLIRLREDAQAVVLGDILALAKLGEQAAAPRVISSTISPWEWVYVLGGRKTDTTPSPAWVYHPFSCVRGPAPSAAVTAPSGHTPRAWVAPSRLTARSGSAPRLTGDPCRVTAPSGGAVVD